VNTPREKIQEVIGRTQIFAGLSPVELGLLAQRAVRKLYSAGETLFTEGEPCNGLYIVARGRVRIFKTSASGREQVLAVEGPGATVAELPVFDGGPYPASTITLEETEIVFLSRRDLHALCMENPSVALKLLAVVGARLRRLVGIIEELSFTTVRQRLISTLLRYASAHGQQTPEGIAFLLPASHQEMANEIGTVRELVSRNLTRLQSEGYLEVDGRKILIHDIKAFTALQENP
jgi:CRP-like cAMP-binding protein